MSETANWVVETTTESFETDVVARSKEVPVIIDFWAPWCAPCRELGPILEKLAEEYAGKFVLAKVDIETSQELAAAFNVQSIPCLAAIRGGQLVDQFVGLLPEAELRRWIDSMLPTPAEQLLMDGTAIEETDPAAAEEKFREAALLDPKSDPIKIHLARVLVAQNRTDDARELIDELEKRGFLEPEAKQIKSKLDLQSVAEDVGDLEAVRQLAEQSPNDLSLRLKLAEALAGVNKYDESLELCLSLVQQDKGEVGTTAKNIALKILNLLGSDSELARDFRKKLASALY